MTAVAAPVAVDFYERKAEQLQRDFGIPHPMRQLRASLRRRDDREVTPFQGWHARKRIAEITARPGVGSLMEACIIMLMRGARVENLAVAMGYTVNRRVNETQEFVEDVKTAMRGIDWYDGLIGESQRGLDLWRRA